MYSEDFMMDTLAKKILTEKENLCFITTWIFQSRSPCELLKGKNGKDIVKKFLRNLILDNANEQICSMCERG